MFCESGLIADLPTAYREQPSTSPHFCSSHVPQIMLLPTVRTSPPLFLLIQKLYKDRLVLRWLPRSTSERLTRGTTSMMLSPPSSLAASGSQKPKHLPPL